MPAVDPQHVIEELQVLIHKKDLGKAKLMMANIRGLEPQLQRLALAELTQASDEFVFPMLVGLLADANHEMEDLPEVREMLFSRALDNPALLIQMLMRELKPNHRVVLAEIAGELKLDQATPMLLSIINEEQDEWVLRGAIQALGMIGDPSATTPISEYLYSGSVELIIAAIQALGQLSNPTAIQRLAEKMGADHDLDAIIIDVFARSQAPEALERLNALLSAQHAHLRNAAKQRMLEIGRKAVPVLINNLLYDDPDLLIHTLNLLGAISDESAVQPIRKLLHNDPKNANVRFAAYEALGMLPTAKGAFALAQGLTDSVDNVRSAAAGAIDRNYNTVLAAGIKNMIRDEDPAQRRISRTIMDAECDTIFLDLIQEEMFREFALDYLSRRAHTDTRNHFISLLKANGQTAIAETIVARSVTETKGAPRVFVVDDSKMILNIYRSVLHNLGYEPVLFEFPAEAIKRIQEEEPDLIFTDLNMPEISGVELTKTVRKRHSKESLPIVMVTTQNECQDNDAAIKAGVNAILNKPFNEKMLKAVMEAQLGGGRQR